MSNYSNNPALSKPVLRLSIVDDSTLIRQIIRVALQDEPCIEIVGEAADPYEAREMIKAQNPDVITLDIEMPRMNGIDFLAKIMALRPMPVIMISTLTQKGADITLQALEMGAVDYIAKPNVEAGKVDDFIALLKAQLIPKLQALAAVNHPYNVIDQVRGRLSAPIIDVSNNVVTSHKLTGAGQYDLIVMASSTGGVERLRYLISNLANPSPPIMIVQHINAQFIPRMVARMQEAAPEHMTIEMAAHMMPVQTNHVYFANNLQHMTIIPRAAGQMRIALVEAPPLNGFIASADYLFNSAADLQNSHDKMKILGGVLSGMGVDGAHGMLKLRNAGAMTIGENEESCLIYGMPKAAADINALHKEYSIEHINKILHGGIMA